MWCRCNFARRGRWRCGRVSDRRRWLGGLLLRWVSGGGFRIGGEIDVPEGNAALERSHVAAALSIWSAMRGEMPFRVMRWAIVSTVCVGAARSAVGARARTRERVFVKIIVKDTSVVWYSWW